MVIFNSYVSHNQRVSYLPMISPKDLHISDHFGQVMSSLTLPQTKSCPVGQALPCAARCWWLCTSWECPAALRPWCSSSVSGTLWHCGTQLEVPCKKVVFTVIFYDSRLSQRLPLHLLVYYALCILIHWWWVAWVSRHGNSISRQPAESTSSLDLALMETQHMLQRLVTWPMFLNNQ